jgi:predicted aspartyl protease
MELLIDTGSTCTLVSNVNVFSGKCDTEVLGFYILEGLGLEVDPTMKQVRKAEALLAL